MKTNDLKPLRGRVLTRQEQKEVHGGEELTPAQRLACNGKSSGTPCQYTIYVMGEKRTAYGNCTQAFMQNHLACW